MAMTYEEVLYRLKDHFRIHRNTDFKPHPKLEEAIRLAYKAIKKQIPKKPKYKQCPNCSTGFSFITENLANPKGHKIIYCWNCGQAIDWSDDNA